MECSDFISFLTSCLISGSKESGLCFLSKHLHDAQQTGRNIHSWQTAVWSLDRRVTSRGGLALSSALSYSLSSLQLCSMKT